MLTGAGTAHLGVDPLPGPWRGGHGPRLWAVGVRAYGPRADDLRALLDDGERSRLQGFVRAADRARYRVAHVALRQLLGAYLETDPAAVRLVRETCPGCGGPHGRPAVASAGGLPVPLHFSLSHSGDAVLLGFADTAVGVDVEEVPAPEVAAEVAELLHPAERAELAALAPSERAAATGRCWSRKEAYLKGVGIGLGENPSVTYVGTGATPAAVPGWSVSDVRTFPGYTAACVTRTAPTRTGAQAG
ncbi:4'-phosphopantetheinyl transferase superfamily protein [Streptomyces sp. Je 1-79]|uniref:4'-phosphopantetheinyl transferase family protein n=1 Tax=Streptomyces sp. Je 1-79 TaxID=2943847 RepID=UPI0021A8DDFE|nr:4'-phosphopantetheinyl transferase superfamily protein [Streptomyces sp. Je 1-79]MCT4351673.1 4'-phosphopantetheinyl transferase superfamily protein [Streptomyces sp. Je 1-79]